MKLTLHNSFGLKTPLWLSSHLKVLLKSLSLSCQEKKPSDKRKSALTKKPKFIKFHIFCPNKRLSFLSRFMLFFIKSGVVFASFPFFALSAQTFKNSYVSFDIPETWKCKAFGTNWVCHDKFQEKQVEALITSTAKIASTIDTRDQYLSYLQQEKTWFTSKKEQITSKKLTEAKEVFINKFPWVDSTHKNSEVKSYISRYVGTVCCEDSSSKLGILIVLSAHQDHYAKYSSIFVQAVNSLRVLDIEKAISKVRAAEAIGAGEGMGHYLEGLFEDDQSEGAGEGEAFNLKSPQFILLAFVLLATALLYFIIRKKRRAKLRRRSRRRKKR